MTPKRRPLAVIQSGDALENRRRVLPLALAVRDHGWEPVVLIDDIGAAGFFFAHDVACVSVAALGEVDAPEPDFEVDMADLCALPLRRAALGGKPFSDDDALTTWDTTRRISWMLDQLAPQALFVWNGFTGVWANALRVYKAAKSLPGGFMERGPSAKTLFVDPEGVNGDASFANGEGAALGSAFPIADLQSDVLPATPAARSSARRKRVVFVPLQVNDDSNILLHSERIVRMRSLALLALELARALGLGWRAVLRRHPEERPNAALNLPRSLRLRIDDDTTLEDWIDRAGLVLTVNSAVGLTAASRGAPVVCLGEGTYCRQPFVIGGQDCDVARIAKAIRARKTSPTDIVAGARAFLERLAGGSLFWQGQPERPASEKLERCGLARDAAAETIASGAVRIERPGAAYAKARETLRELQERGAPLTVDFDFGPQEKLFSTYRLNREPITREHLLATAQAALGGQVRLAETHRALGSGGEVLFCHSKRPAEDAGRYRLVLDEFGVLHARTYLDRRATPFPSPSPLAGEGKGSASG